MADRARNRPFEEIGFVFAGADLVVKLTSTTAGFPKLKRFVSGSLYKSG